MVLMDNRENIVIDVVNDSGFNAYNVHVRVLKTPPMQRLAEPENAKSGTLYQASRFLCKSVLRGTPDFTFRTLNPSIRPSAPSKSRRRPFKVDCFPLG